MHYYIQAGTENGYKLEEGETEVRKRFLPTVIFAIAIVLFWLPTDASALEISLKVGVNTNLPPYQFIGENGEITGLHIDIMNELSKIDGFDIEYISFPNTYAAMEAMLDNKLDAVIGVPQKKYSTWDVAFSDEINSAALCLVADEKSAKRYEEAQSAGRGMTLALEGDTIDYNHMSNLISSSIILKDSQVNAFYMLQQGYADMLLGVKDSVVYQMREENLEDAYAIIGNYISNVDYSIAIHKDDQYLQALINHGITQLHITGRYGEFRSKWSMADNNTIRIVRLQRFLALCLMLVLIAGVYAFLSRRVKRLLEKEVLLRTKALNEANCAMLDMNKELGRRIQKEKEYSRLLDVIIETAPSAMFLLNNDGMTLHSNQHGLSMSELFQQGTIYFNKQIQDSWHSLMGELMSEAEQQRNAGTILLSFPTEQQRTIRYHIHHMIENDSPSGYLVVMEDVTTETIEQQAHIEKQKNEALNRMVASIAHEIKNPLTTISAAINMVYAKRNDERFMNTFREIVPQEVERINRLIQNLVYYARPPKTTSERLDVAQLLASIEQMVAPLAQRNQVSLEFKTDEGLYVVASMDKLKQVLLNFIINSLESIANKCEESSSEYSPIIRVCAKTMGKFISVSVWDNGVGMEEEQMGACFRPFYSTKPAGTGLGLSVSAQYIHEIGGTIRADGKAGEYANLTVFLPMV